MNACVFFSFFNLERFKGKSEGEKVSNRDDDVKKEKK